MVQFIVLSSVGVTGLLHAVAMQADAVEHSTNHWTYLPLPAVLISDHQDPGDNEEVVR